MSRAPKRLLHGDPQLLTTFILTIYTRETKRENKLLKFPSGEEVTKSKLTDYFECRRLGVESKLEP